MPLNLPLRPLASACRSYVIHSKAFFSTSRVKAAPGFTKSNASNDLLDFENSRTSNASSSPSKTSRKNIALDQIIQNTNALGGVEKRTEEFTEAARLNTERDAVARFQSRKWKIGDVYSPHDMSPSEMYKWSQPRRPSKDVIDILGINPLDHYKNFSMISEYMTEMGRIKPSRMTGLRPVNQRKMAKAIRRAVGMGIHPSTHRHPMIIYDLEDLKNFVDDKAKLARQKSGQT